MDLKESIGIFTDSSSDLSRASALKYDVGILPIQLTVGDRTLWEHYDVTAEEYWTMLEQAEETPKTAQVALVAFQGVYERAKKQGCTHLLGILINGGGSGTFNAACTARQMFYDEHGRDMEIVLLDSRTYTYIYGRVVEKCAALRDEGRPFGEIVEEAVSLLSTASAVLGVYSLKYLKRSGRINGAAAFVGEALGLRPILQVRDGAVDVLSKVRGDKSVVPAIVDQVKKDIVDPASQTVVLLYAKPPEGEIDRLEGLLREELGVRDVVRHPIGPSVATNTGPLAIAVCFSGAPMVKKSDIRPN